MAYFGKQSRKHHDQPRLLGRPVQSPSSLEGCIPLNPSVDVRDSRRGAARGHNFPPHSIKQAFTNYPRDTGIHVQDYLTLHLLLKSGDSRILTSSYLAVNSSSDALSVPVKNSSSRAGDGARVSRQFTEHVLKFILATFPK
jgi:hypothetical protein